MYVTERRNRGEFTRDTAKQVTSVLLSFCRACGDPPAVELTYTHVSTWVESVGGTLARSTLRNRVSIVRKFCSWLILHSVIPSNPCDGLERIRQPRSVPRALPAPAVGDLLASLPDVRAELIVSLMVQEGLRCKEVAGLQVGDLDTQEGTLIVVGKGGHQRMLPISEETTKAMRRYLMEHPSHAGPLIRRYDQPARGLSAHYVSDLVRRWEAESGVKHRSHDGVGAHSLRHTAATDVLRKSGGNVVLVQQMLGHASLQTTQVYLRTYPEDLRKAMEGRNYKRKAGDVVDMKDPAPRIPDDELVGAFRGGMSVEEIAAVYRVERSRVARLVKGIERRAARSDLKSVPMSDG
jgi:site-specific recombinase XerC